MNSSIMNTKFNYYLSHSESTICKKLILNKFFIVFKWELLNCGQKACLNDQDLQGKKRYSKQSSTLVI